jgi:hypothetical protein
MSVERVNYFDRQYLRVQEFTDEQAYQISMRRRHNISHHGWGIVQGLEPHVVDGNLYVTPGIAIDVFGREAILDSQQTLPASAFLDQNSNVLDVWLTYSSAPASPAPTGYAAATNGNTQYYRVIESPQITLLKPSVSSTPGNPAGTQLSDAAFNAIQPAPEDGYWPIFLGRVTSNSGNTDQPYAIDLSNRPYAGLIGEKIVAASGSAALQIGMQSATDTNRLAVTIPAGGTPAMAIDQTGKLTVQGETAIQGNLMLSGLSLQPAPAPAPVATTPQPWRIYCAQGTDSSGNAVSELRVEMAGGGTGANQVVFGAWSTQANKFNPCLTVSDNGTVTVNGNLVVNGQLKQGNVVPGQLSPQAKAIATSSMVSGVSAGPALMSRGPAPVTAASPAAVLRSHLKDLESALAHPQFLTMLKGEFQGVAAELKRLL